MTGGSKACKSRVRGVVPHLGVLIVIDEGQPGTQLWRKAQSNTLIKRNIEQLTEKMLGKK